MRVTFPPHWHDDAGSGPSDRAFLLDARTRVFREVEGSGAGFAGHVCGVVREDGLRVLAVGGGDDGKQVSSST